MMRRTANTTAKRLSRVDAHRAALNVPVNHDAASDLAIAAAFMGCSGSAWEVAPLPDGSVREPSGFCPGKVSWSCL
jgi:hypothetical protein